MMPRKGALDIEVRSVKSFFWYRHVKTCAKMLHYVEVIRNVRQDAAAIAKFLQHM